MSLDETPASIRSLAPHLREQSMRRQEAVLLWLERHPQDASQDRLGFFAPTGHPAVAEFEGRREDLEGNRELVRCTLSPENAAALRGFLSDLTPRTLGLATSVGFGDRLGAATPGHVRALRAAAGTNEVMPIFAQQSIREMTRTRRTPQQVLDDATWGAFEAGWSKGVGADADHLKTPEDAAACAAAGFTMFTIDPGERVDDSASSASQSELRGKIEALPWDALETTADELRRSYEGRRLDAEGLTLKLEGEALARAMAKYGGALAHAASMHRSITSLGVPFEIEVSVDETETPTTLEEHAFLALELRRLGVPIVSLAPRFVGRFEKGVDFRGDIVDLERTLDGHARIARQFGPYKLSLHSGSDKFSVYPLIARFTEGLVHLKTAGTSYLEALRTTAVHDPRLFREILELARERFAEDRASYHVSAQLSRVAASEDLADGELPALLDDDDARQVLHVTFGSALDAFRPRLLALLRREREAHGAGLERHFIRHVAPFEKGPSAGSR